MDLRGISIDRPQLIASLVGLHNSRRARCRRFASMVCLAASFFRQASSKAGEPITKSMTRKIISQSEQGFGIPCDPEICKTWPVLIGRSVAHGSGNA